MLRKLNCTSKKVLVFAYCRSTHSSAILHGWNVTSSFDKYWSNTLKLFCSQSWLHSHNHLYIICVLFIYKSCNYCLGHYVMRSDNDVMLDWLCLRQNLQICWIRRKMTESRQTQYKNMGKDSDALRKTRVENIVSIRKDKREETLSKRRNIPAESASFYLYFLMLVMTLRTLFFGHPNVCVGGSA